MRLEKLFGLMSGLSGTYRFSNAKLVHRESVLEHLGGVTLTCFLIYHEIMQYDDKFEFKVDLDAVMSKAIAHDVEEVLMGDIPRTTKYADSESKTAFKLMETRAMQQIFEDLELENLALVNYHAEAKTSTTGLLVKLADVLAVVYKVHEEAIERGNRAMMSRAGSAQHQLDVCVDEIDKCKDFTSRGKAFLTDLVDQAQTIIDDASSVESAAVIKEKC